MALGTAEVAAAEAEAALSCLDLGGAEVEDRACAPSDTVALVRAHAVALGITRIGLLTGLDRVGVPVGIAVRPNSRSLSVHQGKGLDDAQALASAAMEAAEVAVAERSPARSWRASLDATAAEGFDILDLERTTRCRARRLSRDTALSFVAGRDLLAERPVCVPWPLVGIDHVGIEASDPFDRSSDGLASGNTIAEAVLFGLLELIERDAVALFQASGPGCALSRRRSVAWFRSPELNVLATRFARVGIEVALFDITTDAGIPVAAALLFPTEMVRRPDIAWAAVCGGYGCHHDPATAAIRAVTEACQARVTAIAGARDDIGETWYAAPDRRGLDALADIARLGHAPALDIPAEPLPVAGSSVAARIRDTIERLRAIGVTQIVAVPLPSGIPGLHVVRMLVPGLEIGPGATGRHVGRRLLAALLREAA